MKPAHHKKNSFIRRSLGKGGSISPISLISLIALIAIVLFFFFSRTQRAIPNRELTTDNRPLTTDIPVPEVNSHPGDKNVAVPLAAVESTPGAKTKIRQFNLQAYKSAFQPNIILAYAGDIVRINLFAVDSKYDFSIPALGILQTAQKGETKSMEFQVTITGNFDIVCNFCPEPQKPRGFLVIKPLK